MQKIIIIAGLMLQVTLCSDVALKKLRDSDSMHRHDQYIKSMAEQELASVADQLDQLRQLLAYQEVTPTGQIDTRQNLENVVSMLEQKFVETVNQFDNQELSPEDIFVAAQALFDASCQPLLAYLYRQD